MREPANFSKASFRGDAPDLVASLFGEPEVAIRPGGDGCSAGARRGDRRRGDCELGDDPCGGDTPDLVAKRFNEPQVAILPRPDAPRVTHGSEDWEYLDGTGGAGSTGATSFTGSTADQQQAETDNTSGKQCGQVRPQRCENESAEMTQDGAAREELRDCLLAEKCLHDASPFDSVDNQAQK